MNFAAGDFERCEDVEITEEFVKRVNSMIPYHKCTYCGKQFLMPYGVTSNTWGYKVKVNNTNKVFCTYSHKYAWLAK